MNATEEKIKELIDRECYKNWHAQKCDKYNVYRKYVSNPCWMCYSNETLAKEISDIK